jgi:hypothetical protein
MGGKPILHSTLPFPSCGRGTGGEGEAAGSCLGYFFDRPRRRQISMVVGAWLSV